MSNLKKKNFRIEGFRHGVEVEPCYGEELWVIIENAVHQIYDHHATDLRFEDLYRLGFSLLLLLLVGCSKNLGLYDVKMLCCLILLLIVWKNLFQLIFISSRR
jgi:hypothetical protein